MSINARNHGKHPIARDVRMRVPSAYGGSGTGPTDPGDPGTGTGLFQFVLPSGEASATVPSGYVHDFRLAIKPGDVTPASQHLVMQLADGTALASQQYDSEAKDDLGRLVGASFHVALPSSIAPSAGLILQVAVASGAKSQAAATVRASSLFGQNYVYKISIGGVVWTATLDEALADPGLLNIADGPLAHEVRCLSRCRNAGVAHPDYWVRWYVRILSNGKVRIMCAAYNGNMGNGVNYTLDSLGLFKGVTSLMPGPASLFMLYHSKAFSADGNAQAWTDGSYMKLGLKVDKDYYYDALAYWHFDTYIATNLKTPVDYDYWWQSGHGKGYLPQYSPADIAGLQKSTWAASDAPNRGELGPYTSWGNAAMEKGTWAWINVCEVQSLAYGRCPTYYTAANGEIPVILDKTYPGMPAPTIAFGIGAGGTVTNPSAANSDGWSATDNNTPGGAPRFDAAHHGNHHYIPWLLTGHWWHLDQAFEQCSRHITLGNPLAGHRNWTLGGVTYRAIMFDQQPRGKARAGQQLTDTHWPAPDIHPAKPYLADVIDINWKIYKLWDDFNIYATGQKVLGYIIALVSGNHFRAPTFGQDFMMYTAATHKLRGRGGTDIDWFINIFSLWVFGRAVNGCHFRAASYSIFLTDASGNFITDWGLIECGKNPAYNATNGGQTFLVPVGGCPTSGLQLTNTVGPGSEGNSAWQTWFSFGDNGGYDPVNTLLASTGSYTEIRYLGAVAGERVGAPMANAALTYLETYYASVISTVGVYPKYDNCPRYAMRRKV